MLGTVTVDVVDGQEFKMRFIATWALAFGGIAGVGDKTFHSCLTNNSLGSDFLFCSRTRSTLWTESPFVVGFVVKESQRERLFLTTFGTDASLGFWLAIPFPHGGQATATGRNSIFECVSANDDGFAARTVALPVRFAPGIFDATCQGNNRQAAEHSACQVFGVGASVRFGTMPEAVQARLGFSQRQFAACDRSFLATVAPAMPQRILAGLPSGIEEDGELAEGSAVEVLETRVGGDRMRFSHDRSPTTVLVRADAASYAA